MFWGTRTVAVIILILAYNSGVSSVFKHDTLYINSGSMVTVDSVSFPHLAFNPTPSYSSNSKVIRIIPGDQLVLTIINTDTLLHNIKVQGQTGISFPLQPGTEATDTLSFNSEGVFIYYDDTQFPSFKNIGLNGMICVSEQDQFNYYWNFSEHQSTLPTKILNGVSIDWKSYDPDYFTVNNQSFPDLQKDSTAVVSSKVNDTIRLFLANTGQSAHSIHFHGFHCKVIFSGDGNKQKGRSKDTFPLRKMETYILEMIPDKPGRYAIHDHNLIAVSGGSKHPNGMFLIMDIKP